MEMWLLLLVVVLPPFVLAALRPRTENWRRARMWFWIATLLGVVTAATTLATIELIGPANFFLGPAIFWLFALFLNALTVAIWSHYASTIRSEWREWRDQNRVKSVVTK